MKRLDEEHESRGRSKDNSWVFYLSNWVAILPRTEEVMEVGEDLGKRKNHQVNNKLA